MKVKYLIPILLVILVFSFTFTGCFASSNSPTSEEENNELIVEEIIDNYIEVKYIVIGTNSVDLKNADNEDFSIPFSPEVSVTYSNSQGGTEQISGINLGKDYNSLGLPDIENAIKWQGEVIAQYDNFPINEFMYLSAQNQNAYGNIIVIILIDGIVWKNSLAKGEYAIATANGYYGE
jgi:hypothetical protein